MEDRKIKPKPFRNSLSTLAQLALQEAGAIGYAIFKRLPNSTDILRQDASGVAIDEAAVRQGAAGVLLWPLGADGILAFVFSDESNARRAQPQLDRIAKAIDSVWSAAHAAARYSDLANQVADLEASLMDSRIADRARGFIGNREHADALDAIARHVETVLRPASTAQVLEQRSRDLEEEVEERRLTKRAKTILQNVHGMSEEQAHAHLRQISRKTRRKLKDVAVDLIAGNKTNSLTHAD